MSLDGEEKGHPPSCRAGAWFDPTRISNDWAIFQSIRKMQGPTIPSPSNYPATTFALPISARTTCRDTRALPRDRQLPANVAMVTFKDLRDDSTAPLDLSKEVERLRLQVHMAEMGAFVPADQAPNVSCVGARFEKWSGGLDHLLPNIRATISNVLLST